MARQRPINRCHDVSDPLSPKMGGNKGLAPRARNVIKIPRVGQTPSLLFRSLFSDQSFGKYHVTFLFLFKFISYLLNAEASITQNTPLYGARPFPLDLGCAFILPGRCLPVWKWSEIPIEKIRPSLLKLPFSRSLSRSFEPFSHRHSEWSRRGGVF